MRAGCCPLVCFNLNGLNHLVLANHMPRACDLLLAINTCLYGQQQASALSSNTELSTYTELWKCPQQHRYPTYNKHLTTNIQHKSLQSLACLCNWTRGMSSNCHKQKL